MSGGRPARDSPVPSLRVGLIHPPARLAGQHPTAPPGGCSTHPRPGAALCLASYRRGIDRCVIVCGVSITPSARQRRAAPDRPHGRALRFRPRPGAALYLALSNRRDHSHRYFAPRLSSLPPGLPGSVRPPRHAEGGPMARRAGAPLRPRSGAALCLALARTSH